MDGQDETERRIHRLPKRARLARSLDLIRTKRSAKLRASTSLMLGVVAGALARVGIEHLTQAQSPAPIFYAKEIAGAVVLAAGWIGLLKYFGTSRPRLLLLVGFSLGFGFRTINT